MFLKHLQSLSLYLVNSLILTKNMYVDQSFLIITARKRSLGQGNVFTPVCHSVHRDEGIPTFPHWMQTPLDADPLLLDVDPLLLE